MQFLHHMKKFTEQIGFFQIKIPKIELERFQKSVMMTEIILLPINTKLLLVTLFNFQLHTFANYPGNLDEFVLGVATVSVLDDLPIREVGGPRADTITSASPIATRDENPMGRIPIGKLRPGHACIVTVGPLPLDGERCAELKLGSHLFGNIIWGNKYIIQW